MGGMLEMSGREVEGKLASRVVGSIVEMQSNEIEKISKKFAKKKAELEKEHASNILSPAEEHAEVMKKLQEKFDELNEECVSVDERLQEKIKINEELSEKLNLLQDYQNQAKDKLSQLEEREENADKDHLLKIRELIKTHEALKHQEKSFKAKCREESDSLKQQIADLKEQIADETTVDDSNLTILKDQYLADKDKLAKIRLSLASKTRQVASLFRKLDEIPSRAELTQYQKRFVELNDQVCILILMWTDPYSNTILI